MNSYKLSTLKKNYYNTDFVMYDDACMLLFPNSILSSKLYNTMKEANMNTIFSKGFFEQSIDLSHGYSEEEAYALDLINSKNQENAQLMLETYYEKICAIFETIYTKKSFSFEQINTLVYEEIYPFIKKNPHIYLAISDFTLEEANPYITLFMKNMIFSLSVLEAGSHKVITNTTKSIEMCIAALLLDIGVLLIIKHLEDEGKPSNINIRNTKIVSLISKITDDILKKSFVPPIICSIVEHTHALLMNPSHAPLSHIENLIYYTTMLSTFVYLTTPLPSHEHQIPFQALHLIIKNSDKVFPSKYVKDMSQVLGYIPPGSFVELNNGSKAYVIQNQVKNLKSPLVQLLQSSDGTEKDKPIVIETSVEDFAVKRVFLFEDIETLQIIRANIT